MASLRPLLPAALVCAAVTTILPAPAHASAGMELALQDDNVFVQQYGMTRAPGRPAAKRLGVKRIRVTPLGARSLPPGASSRKAPAAPAYNFAAVDQLQQEAALRGIRLQLTL